MAAWIFAGLRKSLKASEEKAKQKETIISKGTGLAWKLSWFFFSHDQPLRVAWLKEEYRRSCATPQPGWHLPEPSLFLYRMPLIFRHRTGSSFSYTDGSQLYLVPLFPWTAVKGVGGDCGPWRKEKRKVRATKRQSGCSIPCLAGWYAKALTGAAGIPPQWSRTKNSAWTIWEGLIIKQRGPEEKG